MNTRFPLRIAAVVMLLSIATGLASAADDHGHDHGDAASATGAALPRFAAVSEAFELVGVLDGKRLTLYLDRFGDNSPVKDAQLDLQVDGAHVDVKPFGEGKFEAMLAEAPNAGVLSVAATVVAGNESDLLAGELDIHETAHAEAASGPRWQRWAGWGLAAAVVLGLAAWAGRRAVSRRQLRIGGAA